MVQKFSNDAPILCIKSEKNNFIWSGIILIVTINGALLISGVSVLYVLLSIAAMIITLYFVDQKDFKQFELYKDKFVVKYPWSLLYKTKIYDNKSIKSIKIRTPKGRGETMLLRMKWEENSKIKKRNHWYTMDNNKTQRLIDEMRNLNIEVEIDDISNYFH